jgi:hypothetical protein
VFLFAVIRVVLSAPGVVHRTKSSKQIGMYESAEFPRFFVSKAKYFSTSAVAGLPFRSRMRRGS